MNDCRLDKEDREFLTSFPEIPEAFKHFARPESIGVEWHKSEQQGQIGSCQGNDLASCLERLQHVAKKPVTQLSRIFAYLATQKIDGLLGSDRGSTISGGAKLATTHGVPPEALTGYPRSYPGGSERQRILSAENYAAGEPFKALSLWKVPADPDEAKNWIAGGGAITIGIAWPGVPTSRVIANFRGGRGGHAIAVLGYDPGHLVAVNSHGDGPFRITDAAWRQMHAHSYTAMVGLAGSTEPEPVNWSEGYL